MSDFTQADYKVDKYRVPTGYNWLKNVGNPEDQSYMEFISVNNVYRKAVRSGRFSGGFSEFLSVCGDSLKKYQNEDGKIHKSNENDVLLLIPSQKDAYNATGDEQGPKPTIWGVRPWVFYAGALVVLSGIGYGVYSLVKAKK